MAEIQQKSESSDSSSGVSYLPSSLILEIIVKLPIKSVIQCRCVCKNWNALISESHFATLYFKNPPFTVLVLTHHESFYFAEVGLNGDVMRTPFNPKAMDFRRTGRDLFTIDSCNGLICFVQSPPFNLNVIENRDNVHNNEAVYIINPVLGEVMVLPKVNQSGDIGRVFYGFGFSTQSDRYKVLRIVPRLGPRIHGEIFTIGADYKWRSFQDSLLPLYLYSSGVNLNGVVYFVGDGFVGDGTSCPFGFILAFDMEEERGHRIPLPSEFGDERCRIVLAVCNDNLCLTDSSGEHQVVIWTMKIYGVVESWSKEIILKSCIPLGLSSGRLISPLTTLRNGDLLMSHKCSFYENSGVLISYNPKTKECRKLEFGVGEWDSAYLFEYFPSFFPINNVL